MASHLIAQLNVRDRDAFREYERGVLRTIKPFKGWVLAAGPAGRVEGAEDGRRGRARRSAGCLWRGG